MQQTLWLRGQQAFAASEVDRRLRDLTWVFGQAEQAHAAYQSVLVEVWTDDAVNLAASGSQGPERTAWAEQLGERSRTAATSMRIHAEYFYWSAARIRRNLRELLGMRKFDVIGPREIRNHVLEHPQSLDTWGKVVASIAGDALLFSEAELVVFSNPPQAHRQTHRVDAGLRTNAAEFRDALDTHLRTALLATSRMWRKRPVSREVQMICSSWLVNRSMFVIRSP